MNILSTQPMTHELTALGQQAFTDLQSCFHGTMIQPSDAANDEARHVWNGMIDKYPALIARCADTEDVITTINFARQHNLLLAVRGGGHNAAATAFGDRSAPFWLVFNTTWADPAESEENIAWTRNFWQQLQPFARAGIYMNFPGLNEEGNRLVRASHGGNYERFLILHGIRNGFCVKCNFPVFLLGHQ